MTDQAIFIEQMSAIRTSIVEQIGILRTDIALLRQDSIVANNKYDNLEKQVVLLKAQMDRMTSVLERLSFTLIGVGASGIMVGLIAPDAFMNFGKFFGF